MRKELLEELQAAERTVDVQAERGMVWGEDAMRLVRLSRELRAALAEPAAPAESAPTTGILRMHHPRAEDYVPSANAELLVFGN